MPFARNGDARIYWRLDGHPDKPALVLLNSLGTDMLMWDPVVPALTQQSRLLRMDMRGHGASSAPSGDYTLGALGGDVLAVMDAAGLATAALCGLSLGGMVAQHLALAHPERFTALVACNTSSIVPPGPWDQRARLVREKGVEAIADAVIERFFSPGFRATGSPLLASVRSMIAQTDKDGYAGCCCAIRDMRLWDAIPGVRLPTLVVNGEHDEATPGPDHGAVVAARIPGARLVALPTGHLSCIEAPHAFASAVTQFLGGARGSLPSLEGARAALFEHGLRPRKAVLGAPWVEKALAGRNAFSGEFQEFITRYAWGEIWGRPGLDHRTRRLLVLATTIALGRWEEFRLHVRAGIEQDGFSLEELREVIMQAGIYAGVPAANTGFHHAEDVLKALGRL